MHSSTSSSEMRVADSVAHPERMTSAERLTAADRPGIAQPVPERPVPAQPWGRILTVVAIVVTAAMAVWEWRMRALGLEAGDIRDNPSFWAEQRRRIDSENVPVAIVGDSRILFDTSLDRFDALTGIRPLQLALAGTNARPFLEELSRDPNFKGLAIVGISEGSFFRMDGGLYANALDRYHFESPSQRSSFIIFRWLSRVFAFMDGEYRLSVLLRRLDHGVRPHAANNPYEEPWKVSYNGEDRDSSLWQRLETDPYLLAHARAFWARGYGSPPVSDEVIQTTLRLTREAVDRIRARGGDVVFVRPPSTGPYRMAENRKVPRARVWDALLAAANAEGLHADDNSVESALFLPEFSHLTRACAKVYTDAYVRRLASITPRVKLRADAPPPLTPEDCRPSAAALQVQQLLRERGW